MTINNHSHAKKTNNVKYLVLPKKPTENNKTISKEKEDQLRDLFTMDGITPYQASQVVGIHRATALKYFEQWANELIDDPEHESWAFRQKRVRVRALEGVTKKIIFVSTQRTNLEKILDRHLFITNGKEKTMKPPEQIQDNLILAYNRTIMDLTGQLMILHDEYDAIDSQPPAAVILKQEILELASEIQRID